MAEDTILGLMVSHHALIEVLFSLFKNEAAAKSSKAADSLSDLTWEVKKHFFIEESAIFDFLPVKTMDLFKTVNHLKEEHTDMLSSLKNFSDNLAGIKDYEFESFHTLLEEHRETEEKILYPRLDKEMEDDQKRQIIHRINEVPVIVNLKK